MVFLCFTNLLKLTTIGNAPSITIWSGSCRHDQKQATEKKKKFERFHFSGVDERARVVITSSLNGLL